MKGQPQDSILNFEPLSLLEEIKSLKKSLKESQECLAHSQDLLVESSKEHQIQMRNLCHEIVNPLQILSMSLEVMLEKSDENPTLERMKRATDRIEKIILETRKNTQQLSKSVPIV